MASSSYVMRLKKKINDVTECPICCETISDGRVLPCIHSFCFKCLQEYGKDKSSGDALDCPVCRKQFTLPSGGIPRLPVNHFINKVIDISRLSVTGDEEGNYSDQLCDRCERIATEYCLNCMENLCSACLQRHQKGNISKSHGTVGIKQKPSRDEKLLKSSVNFCKNHPSKEIDLYCYDCNAVVCFVCYISQHKDHKCYDITKSSGELSQEVDGLSETVTKYMKEVNDLLQKIAFTQVHFTREAEEISTVITKRYEELQVKLEAHYKELMDDLRERSHRRQKELETLKEESERELVTLKSFERYWSEVKAKGSATDLVQAASDLKTRAEELIALHKEQQPERTSRSAAGQYKLEFTPPPTSTSDQIVNMLGRLTRTHDIPMKTTSTDWTRLIQKSSGTVLHTALSKIRGLALSTDELFLVSDGQDQIYVYNLQNLAEVSRQISVPGMKSAGGLVFNTADNCLYASNNKSPSCIHKINLNDNAQTHWKVQNGKPLGLSISNQDHILVTMCDAGRIDEYDTSGRLVRNIPLGGGVIGLYHTIELASGEFVFCQGSRKHRICLTDSSGRVISSYGQSSGSEAGQLCYPIHLAVDDLGQLLVADSSNNKLRVFSPTLQYLGDVNPSDMQIIDPIDFCWDAENGRLVVGDSRGNLTLILAQL